MSNKPSCRRLVLDAGPLLSLSPLRGLAETFYTVPQVLAELKDPRAREHLEKLGLMSGVKVEVRSPDAASLSHAINWSKKTGDYSVLSHPDLCVIALTYALHEEDKKLQGKGVQDVLNKGIPNDVVSAADAEIPAAASLEEKVEDISKHLGESSLETDNPLENADLDLEHVDGDASEPLEVQLAQIQDHHATQDLPNIPPNSSSMPVYDDPSDSDDGEGEWITPDNVALYKSRALDLLPENGVKDKGKAKVEHLGSGCMTADFAMQNVILQMGLNLVGLEGRRIEKVKNWVLRCHACFKICKDHSKKFCPSCGNPTLLRASVTVSAPNASADAPVLQVHLKPNFQYKIRGTKYSIPAPRAGSAKTGTGTGLILREDQLEYVRAKTRADGKRAREEDKLLKGLMAKAGDGKGTVRSSWMDPDWMPEILSVGAGGKGRTAKSSRMDDGLPQIGYGKKNPNERRRKK